MQFSPGNAIRFGWEAAQAAPLVSCRGNADPRGRNIAASIVSGAVDTVTGGSMDEPTLNLVSYLLGILIKVGMTAFSRRRTTIRTGWSTRLSGTLPFWNFSRPRCWHRSQGIGLVLLIVPGPSRWSCLCSRPCSSSIGVSVPSKPCRSMRLTKGAIAGRYSGRSCRWRWSYLSASWRSAWALVAGPVAGLAYVHAYRMFVRAPRIQPPDGGSISEQTRRFGGRSIRLELPRDIRGVP